MIQSGIKAGERLTETVKPVLSSAIEKTTPLISSAIERTIGVVERIDPDSANREAYFKQDQAEQNSAA